MKPALITGIGAITPLGNTFSESFEGVLAGRVGAKSVFKTQKGGYVVSSIGNAQLEHFFTSKDIIRYDPFVLYFHMASVMALQQAGLYAGTSTKAGIIAGSGRGPISFFEQAAKKRPTAYLMATASVSSAASFTSERLALTGPIMGISSACASGAMAIGEALRLIQSQKADIVIAGGADAPLTSACVEGYSMMGALSASGKTRPFDSTRDGFVLSEGACVMVLESQESAKRRNAPVWGELIGYANTSACIHPTLPEPDGEVRAMLESIKDAGLTPKDIDYLSAHATGTKAGDRAEARAITEVFGPFGIYTASIKGSTGHMLAGSSAFEPACALYALKQARLPATANLHTPDKRFKLNLLDPRGRSSVGLVNSFGFGGVNVSLVVRKAGAA